MEFLQVPFIYLHNRDLTLFDSVILSYIKSQIDDSSATRTPNNTIVQALGINPNSLPSCLDKLYKLGYIEIHHENEQRIITYTYDAPHSLSNSGYIYIMKDTTHDYLKIGFSKDPKYRESTLQGEKPTIQLLGKWKGTISQEQTCHRILAKFRVRGEWFNVDQQTAEQTIKSVIGIK